MSEMTPSEILGDHGPFSETLEGYIARKGQQGLSDAIDKVVHNKQVLVAEAGTGIGKTFAYLVPVLLSGKKTLISTGTRHLQDQLFHRDLQVVKKTLNIELPVA